MLKNDYSHLQNQFFTRTIDYNVIFVDFYDILHIIIQAF